MVAPFIVIRTFRQGKLEGLKQSLPKFFEIIAAKEARLLALNAYLNEAETEVTSSTSTRTLLRWSSMKTWGMNTPSVPDASSWTPRRAYRSTAI